MAEHDAGQVRVQLRQVGAGRPQIFPGPEIDARAGDGGKRHLDDLRHIMHAGKRVEDFPSLQHGVVGGIILDIQWASANRRYRAAGADKRNFWFHALHLSFTADPIGPFRLWRAHLRIVLPSFKKHQMDCLLNRCSTTLRS